MDSIGYYNLNAKKYYEDTVELSMEDMLERFIELLPENSAVLDLGCGSGRDSLYLIERGFDVTSLDGSSELCELAEIHVGQDIIQMDFKEIDFKEVFEGIWACASLLHVEREEFHNILRLVVRGLKEGGILYMSFRYGDFSGYRGERYFQDYTEHTLEQVVEDAGGLEILQIKITDDIRDDRGQKWINILARKRITKG